MSQKRLHEGQWDTWSEKRFKWFGDRKFRTARVQSFAKFIERDFKVLDIGCGPGIYYNAIVNELGLILSSNYTGVDNNEGMIREARRRYKDGDFRIGDAYNLEFDDKSFDVSLSIEVLNHIPDYRPLITEMFRVSKKYVIIMTWWTEGRETNRSMRSIGISKHINRPKFIEFLESLEPEKILLNGKSIIVTL